MLAYAGQIIEQALLIFPLVLGIYLSFSILKIADLTVDGSLVLGAAIFARLISLQVHWSLAIAASILGGIGAGVLVALIERHNRVDPLIAGILMAFILNSVSLLVMQRPNIGLLSNDLLFDEVMDFLVISMPAARLLTLSLVIFLLVGASTLFLKSRLGLWLKAFGNNAALVAMLGKNPERFRIIGLALSNALAALSGCLTAQASGYADINMGFGQALIGIAIILIGRQLYLLFKKRNMAGDLAYITLTLLGTLIYFILINEVIRYGLSPVYLKMAIGAFLIIFLWAASDKATQGRSVVS